MGENRRAAIKERLVWLALYHRAVGRVKAREDELVMDAQVAHRRCDCGATLL